MTALTTDYAALPVESLRAALLTALREIAQRYLDVARIITELERRGEDLSEVKRRIGWSFDILRRVALGSVLPSVFERFVGMRQLLEAVAAMPLDVQARLGDGEKVPLKKGRVVALVDPLELSAKEIRQVFAGGRIVPADKQTQAHCNTPTIGQRREKFQGVDESDEDEETVEAIRAINGRPEPCRDDEKPIDEAKRLLLALRSRFGHIHELAKVWAAVDAATDHERWGKKYEAAS